MGQMRLFCCFSISNYLGEGGYTIEIQLSMSGLLLDRSMINIPDCKIKEFIFDKFLYKLKSYVRKWTDLQGEIIVCFHVDSNDLLKM